MRLLKLACLLSLAFAVAQVHADDPTPANLKGAWFRESDGFKLTFEYKEKTVEIVLEKDGNKTIIDCDYGIGRDRSIFCRVQEVKEGSPNLSRGDTFSFAFDVNKDKAAFSELKTKDSDSDLGRQIRMIVEGEYTKK